MVGVLSQNFTAKQLLFENFDFVQKCWALIGTASILSYHKVPYNNLFTPNDDLVVPGRGTMTSECGTAPSTTSCFFMNPI